MSDDLLVTFTISITRSGDIIEDTQAHGNDFAEVYRGMMAIKEEVDRLVEQRRMCPFNPLTDRKNPGELERLIDLWVQYDG